MTLPSTYKCPKCGNPVVTYMQAGEPAVCTACSHESIVPAAAESTNETPAAPVRSRDTPARGPAGTEVQLSNTEEIPGKTITEFYGIVSGSTVRAKNIGRDFMAGLKNLVGGELEGYTELLKEAREQAIERMTAQAESVGANAVVNVRFSTSSIAQGAAELFAYGTAVRVR